MSLFSRHSGPEAAELSFEGSSPGFDGAIEWINSEPLTMDDLKGRVVLVDFWTYTCINWLRTLPYIRAWSEEYRDQGLVVVGVHTPEFPFEHDVGNVRRLVQELRVDHPVAIDSDYAVWDAFANRYWPALYAVDPKGAIRYTHFGEGRYAETERVVQQLLGEDAELVSVEGSGLEAPADWDHLETPETYVGYARGERFASPEGAVGDVPQAYSIPEGLGRNQWALGGEWVIHRQSVDLREARGRLAFRFHARDLHLVLAPPKGEESARFRVLLDGEPPGAARGDDVDEQGNGALTVPRLHQLIRQPGRVEDRAFEIEFLDPGAQVYAFTFG
jgi:thiol-disulfide isomerase/thioredoxin